MNRSIPIDCFFLFNFRMDTYGKCGDLKSAREIFDRLKIQTKPSVSSMSKLLIELFLLNKIDSF
jgi:pentatricopeptide repeat protein